MTDLEMNKLADMIAERLYERLSSSFIHIDACAPALPCRELRIGKPVIGMADLRDADAAVIKVKAKAIITPLARDYIRDRKIQIKYVL